MNIFEQRLCIFAFYSRLSVLFIQFFANFLIPDHDADVFNPPDEPSHNSWIDQLVVFFFSGLRRWDAVYFTHIMQYGYTYENSVAFFPLYPLVVSNLAMAVPLGSLHFSTSVLLVGAILNVVLFVATALVLYRLGKLVVRTDKEAFYASLLFCVNPASIFMTALYSETMYTFFLLTALLALNKNKKIISSFLLGLSILTRSNGLVGIGFILHHTLRGSLSRFHQIKSVSSKCTNMNKFKQFITVISLIIKSAFEVILHTIICAIPFCVFQYYVYHMFCKSSPDLPKHVISYGRSRGYKLAGDEPSAWCNDTIPLSYSYIQKHHWNVGFLTYYTLKQLPNFLLALPAVILSYRACLFYARLNHRSFYCLGLNYFKEKIDGDAPHEETSIEAAAQADNSGDMNKKTENYAGGRWDEVNSNKRSINLSGNDSTSFQPLDLTVYVYHLAFLTIFGCFFMHIQVLTRMLFSSSPLLYWYVGTLFISGKRKIRSPLTADGKTLNGDSGFKQGITIPQFLQYFLSTFRLTFISEAFKNWHCLNCEFRAIFVYFLTYFLIGTIMFSNFLPWT